jgi:hypothetical protein
MAVEGGTTEEVGSIMEAEGGTTEEVGLITAVEDGATVAIILALVLAAILIGLTRFFQDPFMTGIGSA